MAITTRRELLITRCEICGKMACHHETADPAECQLSSSDIAELNRYLSEGWFGSKLWRHYVRKKRPGFSLTLQATLEYLGPKLVQELARTDRLPKKPLRQFRYRGDKPDGTERR